MSESILTDDDDSHQGFIRLLRLAKAKAIKCNAPQNVAWRNYQTTVRPTGPKFTEKELKRLLSLAVTTINEMSDQVGMICF